MPGHRTSHHVEQVGIQMPALPRPRLAALSLAHPWITSVLDSSSSRRTSLGLLSVHTPGEEVLSGAEYVSRIAAARVTLLGYQHLKWLLSHQDTMTGETSRRLQAHLGRVRIEFPGLIAVNDTRDKAMPALYEHFGRWAEDWHWTDQQVPRSVKIAVAAL